MGTLYIVATPIGNLEDITYRAVKILSTVNVIYAEDTRTSSHLLARYAVTTPVQAFHTFNEHARTPAIVERLTHEEATAAIISDAGTPGIADAAFLLVRAALASGVTVVPIPGPCAAITAIIASGLPCDRFVFENFLSNKHVARKRFFASVADDPRTTVAYESPHRIISLIEDLKEVLPDAQVVVGRELTKIHEEFIRGTPQTILDPFAKKPPRGEIVVLFSTRKARVKNENDPTENL